MPVLDPPLLPIVTTKTIQRSERELLKIVEEDRMDELLDLIEAENPLLCDYLEDQAKNLDESCQNIFRQGYLTIYYLVRSQAEANRLKKQA